MSLVPMVASYDPKEDKTQNVKQNVRRTSVDQADFAEEPADVSESESDLEEIQSARSQTPPASAPGGTAPLPAALLPKRAPAAKASDAPALAGRFPGQGMAVAAARDLKRVEVSGWGAAFSGDFAPTTPEAGSALHQAVQEQKTPLSETLERLLRNQEAINKMARTSPQR